MSTFAITNIPVPLRALAVAESDGRALIWTKRPIMQWGVVRVCDAGVGADGLNWMSRSN